MVIRRDRNNNDEQDEALQRGLAGAERAQNAEDVPFDWQPDNRVEEIIRDVAATTYEFTTDDVWAVIEPMIEREEIEEPPDRRILGSLIKNVERDGLISGTSFMSNSTRRNSAPLKVWRVNSNHAFSTWRSWGAMQPGSEKVQAAKVGLDRSIRENRARLEQQRMDIEALEQRIQNDQDNSDSLRRRGYNKKRIPSFDEIMSLSEDFDQDKISDWVENTIVETTAPVAYYGFDNTWRSDEGDGFVPEETIHIRLKDRNTGEVIGQMILKHRNEIGDIGASADRAIVGYQATDISGRDEYLERMNKVAEMWLSNTYWKDAESWTPEFFPLSIEDNMLERERVQFKKATEATDDYIWEGKTLMNLMSDYSNLFDEDGYAKYIDKVDEARKTVENFTTPIFEDLEKWMATNKSQRDALIALEEEAWNGDQKSLEAIEEWKDEFEILLCETGENNQMSYGGGLVDAVEEGFLEGKITEDEYDFLQAIFDYTDPGFAELEIGDGSHMDINFKGEYVNVANLPFDYDTIMFRKLGLPNFEQFFEFDRFQGMLEMRMDNARNDFSKPNERGITERATGSMFIDNEEYMNRIRMRDPNTSKFSRSKKPMMVNIGDWGKPKQYVEAKNVKIGEIGKRKTYVRPTTFRHRTYSNGRDPHMLYVADVRNTKSTQGQAQRQATTARRMGYRVRTVKTADGWLNFFRQRNGATGYEASGYKRDESMDRFWNDGGIYTHKPKQGKMTGGASIDLKRLPYQRRFGIFNVSPVERKDKPGVYDRKKIATVKFSESRNKGKKMKAVFTFKDGTKKTTHFGGKGYSDYTLHKDPKRKQLYLTRHQKNENWNDPTSPGSLSRWVLWNKESKSDSIEDYKRKFGIQ